MDTKINRGNYEKYVIDFVEGNLKAEILEAFRNFLSDNPDIAAEIVDFYESPSIDISATNVDKTGLYRSFSDLNNPLAHFEELCVAYSENDLTAQEKRKFLNLLSEQPELRSTFNLFAEIRFRPDKKIKLPYKRLLKKEVSISLRRILYYPAAAILLGMILFFIKEINISNKEKNILTSTPQESGTINRLVPISTAISESEVIADKSKIRNSIKGQEIASCGDSKNNTGNEEPIVALKPREISIQNKSVVEDISVLLTHSVQSEIKESIAAVQDPVTKSNNKPGSTSGELFWSALQMGIKGIGNLTENNLALQTKTDVDGKLTDIALSTDRFEVERKIKK